MNFQLTKILRREAFLLVGAKKVSTKMMDINGISREYQSHVLPDFLGPPRYNHNGQLCYRPDWDSDESSVDNIEFITALIESVKAAVVSDFFYINIILQNSLCNYRRGK